MIVACSAALRPTSRRMRITDGLLALDRGRRPPKSVTAEIRTCLTRKFQLWRCLIPPRLSTRRPAPQSAVDAEQRSVRYLNPSPERTVLPA
jgi:hypothetical protein